MKVYKETAHISYNSQADNDGSIFYNELTKIINNMQTNNHQVEVQYNTCATNNTIVYSAIILGYMEEPNV